jgi:O-methyltransferase
LPEPSLNDGPDSLGWAGTYAGSEERVRQGFADYAKPARLQIRAGWFEETVPQLASEVGPIAILHVDADWYDSVSLVLRTLYRLVVPGGFVIIDDYGSWVGARRATDEFRVKNSINAPMSDDHYWRV